MAQRAAQIAGHLNYPKGMLAGQVAIITGSGQGIGAEAARLFANEGAKVVVSDIDAGNDPPAPMAEMILILDQRKREQSLTTSTNLAAALLQFQGTCWMLNISKY